MTALLIAAPGPAQSLFKGEKILSFFDPSRRDWEVSFERDAKGFRQPRRAIIQRSAPGVAMRLRGSPAATGLGAVPGHFDLSGYEEIHIWVRADAKARVQPFSQTSGFIFRDGGDPDTVIAGDGPPVCLKIRRESMADPSMVESIGIQVRPGVSDGAVLRVLAVTAIPRLPAPAPAFALSGIDVPASASVSTVFTIDFDLSRAYDNPYDPDQIDVQARFSAPSGREIVIPAFWYQDYTVGGTQKTEQYIPAGPAHWRVRFLPVEEGQHSVRLKAQDKDGNVDQAGPFSFIVSAGQAPGPVRRHASNPVLLQYTNGAPYMPLGHNLGFEDGNPGLNGTAYYRSLLPSFASSGENWTRLWMTDFSRTALEWTDAHWSGFYQGLGTYSLRAAWRVDQFFEIALANGVQVQLVLNDHGQFSTFANQRWNTDGSGYSGNPYNSAFGGPVPQANPEQFFSNAAARNLFRRRLHYLVARWSAYPNLLAWELFNEVQWAGTQSRNFYSDGSTRAAIVAWHSEMADFLRAQDPFGHLITTSSDDGYGFSNWVPMWTLASIDLVQSHHYGQPPGARDTKIRDYVAAAQQAYNKPVIIGEMGVKADSVPECNFDPDNFLADSSVLPVERTPANRDHMVEGTTLRNGLWSAALSQSGAMNWWWGCYVSDDPGRHRRSPDFPLNMRLFPPLISFWGGEDPAAEGLENVSLQTAGQIFAYGLQGPASAFVWVRDARNAYLSGFGPATTESRNTDNASITLSGFTPGSYVLSFYSSYGNGDLISQSEISAAGGMLNVALPSFQGDIAFKIGRGVESAWGAVPRMAKAWIAGDDAGEVRVLYSYIRCIPGFSDALGGAVLTISDGQSPASELTVPALSVSKSYWTVAEIGAPSHTGLALVNTASAVANIMLRLYKYNGEPAGTHTLALAPGEHVAKFLVEPDWFGQALAPFRGALEVSSDVPLGALALRGTYNDQGQFIMTSIPARGDEVAPAGQTEALPQVADGGGYQTEWLMLNPSDAPLSGKIVFRKSDGSAWLLSIQGTPASELQYSIPARGLIRWLTAGAVSDVGVGYCLLAPDPGQTPPAGGAVIRYLPGGVLRSETGLPFLPPSLSAGTYWEVGADLDTGVALVNTAERDQVVRLQLFLRDGSEQTRETQVSLPAAGHTAKFVSELFPGLPSGSRGYLKISADSPCGFLPLRMRTTSRGVLFSSLLLGLLTGGEDRVLPQVVSGGGYRTQFIIANPGNLTASGRIRFYDAEGRPARLLLRRPQQ